MQQAEMVRLERLGALCIERRILPLRVYRDAAGSTRRYFPLKLPVALNVERAVLVYVDPGYETARALRSRGAAHRGGKIKKDKVLLCLNSAVRAFRYGGSRSLASLRATRTLPPTLLPVTAQISGCWRCARCPAPIPATVKSTSGSTAPTLRTRSTA